ncbi:hypothetical protein GX51_04620 [Blastomyces parvus]|uniref:tRNA nucleotidyltransferase (CCA-adding enzyme) n=1 Tax=Blastomyces parvus TaxID=2060905 RepID=A0A2B7X148_9EURO|nr:hypothetical protein GX51_04620 [Blastomyces parvus]
MTKEMNTSSTVPRITLTPIEQTLRLCLLDAVEFIQQRDKEDTQTVPTAVEPLVLRFAGGWVRDKLLGVDSHDIDVAINCMTGERFGERLKEYLEIHGNLEKYKALHSGDPSIIDCITIHKIEKNPEKSKHLETATTKIFGLDIDLVNLRKETYTDDSRNPQVEIGTPEEDALRRDATVNALFYNIHTDMIEDFTGKGLQDMENKIIRTPMAPFQTFKDDPLRVLRLIRFASRLGYSIDNDTEEAMKIGDIKAALKAKISQERIGVEVEKTLRGPDPLTALQRINRLGLYDTIFANHRDNVGVDISSWERGYNALTLLLSESIGNTTESQKTREYVRDTLIRDENERYFAWFLTALAPWANVPDPAPPKPSKPIVPRATTVARDSLRADNKTASIISAASKNYHTIWDIKSSFLKNEIADTASETRVKMGQFIRTLSHNWRLCFVLAMLLEVMRGQEVDHVFRNYEMLLSYIENTNLLDVCSLQPPINGRDIMNALGVKTGPWMTKAMDMVIEWQLRNPDEASKEAAINEVLRRKDEAAACKSLKAVDDKANYHIDTSEIEPDLINLRDLWSEISANEPSGTTEKACLKLLKRIPQRAYTSSLLILFAQQCEDLLLVEAVLKAIKPPASLQREDREAARFLTFWTASAVLPNEDVTSLWENAQLADSEDAKRSQPGTYKLARLKSNIGVSVLRLLNLISPIEHLEGEDAIDIIVSLAAFTCRKDPWTTERAFNEASTILQNYESSLGSGRRGELTAIQEDILKKKIKPLFSKTKTPAVTAGGRKNVHPLPQPRFDPSILDPESKPWKLRDVYMITVLSWVIGRYSPSDKLALESHFPLLVPAILSLIDDDSLSFKAKGCKMLSKFLTPLEQSNSDILRRTNLDSVFQDALNPCLLSLPTITPEAQSVHLLQYAYPALLAVIRARFPSPLLQPTSTPLRPTQARPKQDPESQKRVESLTRLLRHGILHSYHHTSNPRPIENTAISSYPHPRLSTLLISQLPPVISELGIHTTKHLQDLVPMISATLSNPFGTAFPPLLAAAVEATRILVLNAWPRIWRWRAELLGGLCACWLHICDDLVDIEIGTRGDNGSEQRAELLQLQCALKVVVAVVRIAIEECVGPAAEESGSDIGQQVGDKGEKGQVIDVDREFGELVQGDTRLSGLLIDNEYFDGK